MPTPEEKQLVKFEEWWINEYPQGVTTSITISLAFKEVAFKAWLASQGQW